MVPRSLHQSPAVAQVDYYIFWMIRAVVLWFRIADVAADVGTVVIMFA